MTTNRPQVQETARERIERRLDHLVGLTRFRSYLKAHHRPERERKIIVENQRLMMDLQIRALEDKIN